VWKTLKYSFIKNQATEDFRDYLLAMVFAIGDIYNHIKDSSQIVNCFIESNCTETTIRQKVYLDELVQRLERNMSDKDRVVEFTFEYFFLINEKYDSSIQMWLKEDFMERIEQAFYANGIYRA
jgi:hypothetical protein